MEDEGLLLDQPAPRRRRRRRLEASSASTSSASTRAGGRSRPRTAPPSSRRASTPRTPTTRATTGRALDGAVNTGARGRDAGDAHDHRPGPAVGVAPSPGSAQPALDARARRRFADFSRAVATRYATRSTGTWCGTSPTSRAGCSRSGSAPPPHCTAVAPHLYRASSAPPTPAIHGADPGSEVSRRARPGRRSADSANTPMGPLMFMREMGCVDARYGGPQRACKGFRAAAGRLLRLSPPPRANAPDQPNPDPDEAQFGDLRRLFRVLDRLRARKRLRVSGNIHLTEFGYQTSPPDRAVGISLSQQTRTCSRRRTSRGRPSACAACRSTSGTTSRRRTSEAAPGATPGGRPVCASTTASPSPCSRRCRRRS